MSSDTPDVPRPRFRVTTGETPHEPVARPWELELLISGAVTFALLQLPGRLDGWVDALTPQLDRTSAVVATLLYYYGKMILYVLICGFSTHLAARAYWVGLIGLESVFPDGVKWEETRYGPILRQVYAQRIGKLQPLIDKADRFCSMIFPAAFSMVTLFLYSILTVGIAAGLSFAVSRLLFGGRYLPWVYFGLVTLWVGLSTVVTLIDRRAGERMVPGSRWHRALTRGGVAVYHLSGMALFGVVFMILFSNLPRRVFLTGMYVGLVGLLGIAFFKDIMVRNGAVRADDYLYLPDGGSRSLLAAHYENLRSAEHATAVVPSIQSDVVTGPYLKLFIPYAPRRLNALMAERCPGIERPDRSFRLVPAAGDTMSLRGQNAVIACWARLQPVTLDGQPLAPSYHFYRHPRTGMRGMVAYLPTAGLSPGEHVLEVTAVPREKGSPLPPRPPTHITFWR